MRDTIAAVSRPMVLAVVVTVLSVLVAGCGSQSGATSAGSSEATAAGQSSETPSGPASVESPRESSSAESPSAESPSAGEKPGNANLPRPLPACGEVWVVGKKLPFRYRGCTEGERRIKARDYFCAFGYPIVTFGGRYYAVTGYRINRVPSLKTSRQFKRALTNCSG